jgi:uncharacterized repeat protein (TIGR03809 family)
MLAATRKWGRIALKWRDLAERRSDHHLDLCKSGRWRHYYSQGEMVEQLRAAVAVAERWAAIAPGPELSAALPQVELQEAA